MRADTPHLDQQHRKRPVLLTWLCVLSFLFGALMLSLGVLTAFTTFPEWLLNKTKAEYERKKEEMGPETLAANRWYSMTQEANIAGQEHNLASSRTRGYIRIGGSCVIILAVWLMWNLRKTGFWLFTTALTASWCSVWLFAHDLNPIMAANMTIYAVVGLVFIALYARHLKHMR